MTPDEAVDRAFLDGVGALAPQPPRAAALPVSGTTSLTGTRCLEIFGSQLASRHLDLAARVLRGQGKGFYTIGSAGHEANAFVAGALRPTDPALLHYRSGAFFAERARQVPGQDPIRDTLLGVVAAADEPIAGGRHKVFGSEALAVIPQTSTIGSHLPRAVGIAFAIDRAARLGVPARWPADAVVVCSFGDASANHSTAAGAINTACHCAYQRLPLPLLLVCEDNGIGISVRTPPGWIEAAYGHRPGLTYITADGCDPAGVYQAAAEAAAWVRERRQPAFLHLRVVRLMGHAGSDAESAYRSPADIAADQARDPLLATARLLVSRGVAGPGEIIGLYESVRRHVLAAAQDAAERPQLRSAVQIMAPLAPSRPAAVACLADRAGDEAARRAIFGGRLPEEEGPLTLALAINRALGDLLASYPELMVFGEDVAVKGGVYGVTRGLRKKAGAARVFDTVLDEQSILGLALGAGLTGLLREAAATGRVLIVDETRRTGGVSEGVLAALADHGFPGPVARVASADSFVPLGDAARYVLVSEEIEKAAAALARRPAGLTGLAAGRGRGRKGTVHEPARHTYSVPVVLPEPAVAVLPP